MKNSSFGIALSVLLMLIGLGACSTEFEVYAPEKEIFVVYSVLDPGDSIQTVRISRAYQVEGDALEYAAGNDLSVPGLDVRLRDNNGQVWTAQEVTGVKDPDGDFATGHSYYQFITDGNTTDTEALQAGESYILEIGTPDAGNYMTGTTTIPTAPQFRGSLNPISGAGNQRCLPQLFLDRDFRAFWRRSEGNKVNYELRVTLEIQDDGEEREIIWKSFKLFDTNVRCNEGSNVVCYEFEEYSLLQYFKRFMPEDGSIYTYNKQDSCVSNPNLVDNLAKSLEFEVTAVDEFLGNYITVNDPANFDLTAAKPEYTNMTGNVDVYGVFGSVVTDIRHALLRDCSEAVLGLNGRIPPPDCELIE